MSFQGVNSYETESPHMNSSESSPPLTSLPIQDEDRLRVRSRSRRRQRQSSPNARDSPVSPMNMVGLTAASYTLGSVECDIPIDVEHGSELNSQAKNESFALTVLEEPGCHPTSADSALMAS